MKAFLVIALQVLVVAFNVRLAEAGPAVPGRYSIEFPCGQTGSVVSMLKQKYREKLLYTGAGLDGVMTFWGSDETNTFTVAIGYGSISCILVAGNHLQREKEGTSL